MLVSAHNKGVSHETKDFQPSHSTNKVKTGLTRFASATRRESLPLHNVLQSANVAVRKMYALSINTTSRVYVLGFRVGARSVFEERGPYE